MVIRDDRFEILEFSYEGLKFKQDPYDVSIYKNRNRRYNILHFIGLLIDGTAFIEAIRRNRDGQILKVGDHTLDGQIEDLELSSNGIDVICESEDIPLDQVTLIVKCKNIKDFKELENKILQDYPRAIRLSYFKKDRGNETLSQFLVNFFTKYNNSRETVYADNADEVQTATGKRRSLGDIFMICKYYYPSCTLKQVFQILNELTTSLRGFRTSTCSMINKRVWYYSATDSQYIYNKSSKDEYDKTYKWYTDQI